ncbi:MAG: hypothetical protein IPJ41_12090 [Phycisphaerales bacterium]|nr:hypothetical protein [Phycisphaerales bacterium]
MRGSFILVDRLRIFARGELGGNCRAACDGAGEERGQGDAEEGPARDRAQEGGEGGEGDEGEGPPGRDILVAVGDEEDGELEAEPDGDEAGEERVGPAEEEQGREGTGGDRREGAEELGALGVGAEEEGWGGGATERSMMVGAAARGRRVAARSRARPARGSQIAPAMPRPMRRARGAYCSGSGARTVGTMAIARAARSSAARGARRMAWWTRASTVPARAMAR